MCFRLLCQTHWHLINNHLPLNPSLFQFYRLDVLYETPEGVLAVCPPSHIITELHRILDMAPPTNNHPVGILTNEHRDTWNQARDRLLGGTYAGGLVFYGMGDSAHALSNYPESGYFASFPAVECNVISWYSPR